MDPKELEGKVRRGFDASRIYGDEPIVKRGAELLRAIPPRIRQMRTLSGVGEDGRRTMERLFLQQGRFMADYTDDFTSDKPCERAVPMYCNLKDDELRTFFTWRTRYRNGEISPVQTPYLLLYCYEMLGQIGVDSAQEGMENLQKLLTDYGAEHGEIVRSVELWIQDYAAYYQLPYTHTRPREQALCVIMRPDAHSPAEFLEAFDMLSRYHISGSALYKSYPDETAEAFLAVYRALEMHAAAVGSGSLTEKLFGKTQRTAWLMFEGAVFCPVSPPPDGVIRLSPILAYHHYRGTWATERSCPEPDGKKAGDLLRFLDAKLRERLKVPRGPRLRGDEISRGEAAAAQKALDTYFEERARRNAPVIAFDSARLEQIRAQADRTTDMLLTPEEREEIQKEKAPEPENPPSDGVPALSDAARKLLNALLDGEDFRGVQDFGGQPMTVLIDEINGAFYDVVGDMILLEGDAGEPVLAQDYLDDWKGML